MLVEMVFEGDNVVWMDLLDQHTVAVEKLAYFVLHRHMMEDHVQKFYNLVAQMTSL
jgi:hypothetical protein